MLPSYLEKITIDEIKDRARKLSKLLTACNLCPNNCNVNRIKKERGLCGSPDKLVVSSIGAHFGEEPPLVGTNGSGTIFLSGCNLSCQFCQNYSISHLHEGYEITIKELAVNMLMLQNRGCHNINFVTPTHYVPQIVNAIVNAIEAGLEVPLVYNCGGYESVETLKLLEDIFDIYMPDIKYSSNENAFKYSGIKNYFTVTSLALKEMFRQTGNLKTDGRGIARRGLLIRHLVLPNDAAGSKKIIDFICNELSKESYVNIMEQYYPAFNAYKYPEINRRITDIEYMNIIDYARNKGLHRGIDDYVM